MKKHIIGFAIFSVIVGTAILVKSILYVPEVKNYTYTSVTKTSCWKMKQEASKDTPPIVRQAVLDLNTKQIDWELKVPRNESSVALHFFVNDSRGARYLETVFAPRSAASDGNLEFTSSYLWLDNLGSYQNLYVVPETISGAGFRMKDFQPKFNEQNATSVILYSGKSGYLTEKYFKK